MEKEEIALRLVESWGRHGGIPADFDKFLSKYEDALNFIDELNKEE